MEDFEIRGTLHKFVVILPTEDQLILKAEDQLDAEDQLLCMGFDSRTVAKCDIVMAD